MAEVETICQNSCLYWEEKNLNASSSTKRVIAYLTIPLLVLIVVLISSFILIDIAEVYRLTAMSISVFVAPFVCWLLIPYLFCRPLNLKKLLVSLVCVLCGYGLAAFLVLMDVGLPHGNSGPYDIFGVLVYALLPSVFFEWIFRYRPHLLLG